MLHTIVTTVEDAEADVIFQARYAVKYRSGLWPSKQDWVDICDSVERLNTLRAEAEEERRVRSIVRDELRKQTKNSAAGTAA
jgi:hypothetical protein